MDFTKKFVFFSFTGRTGFEADVDLGEAMERVPNVAIDVVQAKIVSGTAYEGLTLKMDGQAINYFGNDLKGTALALLDLGPASNGGAGAEENYILGRGEAPVLTIGNTRRITIKLEDTSDQAAIDLATITGGAFIFRLTYPKQPDSITASYAMEIQRGL